MIVFLIFLVIFDQLTKLAAAVFLRPQINTGSFLGLYIGKFPLFSLLLAVLALMIIVIELIKKGKPGSGEILLISGGIGNLIDRIFRPGVIDWINFYGLWFNLADVYITLGVTLWTLKYYLKTAS